MIFEEKELRENKKSNLYIIDYISILKPELTEEEKEKYNKFFEKLVLIYKESVT